MTPLVLAELLTAIKRVIAAGETDLSGLHARLRVDKKEVTWKEGRKWTSASVEHLGDIIKALKAQAAQQKAQQTKKRNK